MSNLTRKCNEPKLPEEIDWMERLHVKKEKGLPPYPVTILHDMDTKMNGNVKVSICKKCGAQLHEPQ